MLGEFKILVLIHDGESKSYLARHPRYDRSIMLHVLPKPETPEYAQLAAALDGLPPASRSLILDRGEQEGSSYIVTERILDFQSLPSWLGKVAPSPPAAASPGGEFTRLFQAAQPPAAPSPVVPPEPPKWPQAPPGEFTRLFSGAGAAAPAQLPIPSEPRKPGAFTKAFLALSDTGPQQQPLPVAAAPSAPPKSGDFTKFFESPLPPARDPLEAARPLTPVPQPQSQPQPQPEPPPPPAKPVVQSAGEYTRMFGTPFPESPAEAPPPSAPAPQPPAPAAAAPPSIPPAAALKAGPSNTILIVIVVVLVVLALALIAFFLIKH